MSEPVAEVPKALPPPGSVWHHLWAWVNSLNAGHEQKDPLLQRTINRVYRALETRSPQRAYILFDCAFAVNALDEVAYEMREALGLHDDCPVAGIGLPRDIVASALYSAAGLPRECPTDLKYLAEDLLMALGAVRPSRFRLILGAIVLAQITHQFELQLKRPWMLEEAAESAAQQATDLEF